MKGGEINTHKETVFPKKMHVKMMKCNNCYISPYDSYTVILRRI